MGSATSNREGSSHAAENRLTPAEHREQLIELLSNWNTFIGDQDRVMALRTVYRMLVEGKKPIHIYPKVVYVHDNSFMIMPNSGKLSPLEWNVAKNKGWLTREYLEKNLPQN